MADDTQRVSWVLPAAIVDRVKAHQEENDFSNQSEAAADLLSGGNDRALGRPASSGQDVIRAGAGGETIVSREAGGTSLGDERHAVPGRVDPHEAYPATNPMVPPGETVETIGTDGAPIDREATGVVGDSEETAEGLPDVGESERESRHK
jgi:hypothetical protein